MKLFGEYLIEKGVISKVDLVKALIVQMKSTPSVSEIVFNDGLLGHDEIFEIFQLQSNKKIGFIEAAKNLKYWNDTVQAEVEKRLTSSRIPLGEVLVQARLAKIETISHALDEFLTIASEQVSEKNTSPDAGTVTDQDQDEKALDEILGSATTPNEESGAEDQVSIYYEYFNVDMFLELTSSVSFSLSGDFSEENIRAIVDLLRTAKGICRLANLGISEKIISSLENKYQTVLKVGVKKVTPPLIEKLEAHSKTSLDLLWNIRDDIGKGINEEDSLTSRKLNQTYIQLVGQEG